MRRRVLLLMAGVALVVAADLLVGGAIREVLRTGTCSSNGYSSQLGGPVQTCPKGSGLISVFLPVSLLFMIIGAMLLPGSAGAYGGASYFSAVGIGALAVMVGDGSEGTSTTFLWIFGGTFSVVGVAGLIGTAWYQWKRKGPPRAESAAARQRTAKAQLTSRGLAVTLGGAAAAAVVTAGLVSWLLAATAPGSTVSLADGAISGSPGPTVALPPVAAACDLLTPALAEQALAPDAKVTENSHVGTTESQCLYASASSGRELRLETVNDWSLIKSSDPTDVPVTGLGDEAYRDNTGNLLAVRKGTGGFRIIIIVPDTTPTNAATIAAGTATTEQLARAVLPLV